MSDRDGGVSVLVRRRVEPKLIPPNNRENTEGSTQTDRTTRTVGTVHITDLIQSRRARTHHTCGPRQNDRVSEARKDGALSQAYAQLPLKSSYNVLRFGSFGTYEEGLDLVDLPLLGLRSGDVGL